ncbi:DNA polymerase III subunit delta' [Bordetella pertussis]|nr:DNA polymerase III subunit delta' [Bordetella pertussis]
MGTLTENLEKVAAAEWIDALQRLFTQRGLATHPLNAKLFVHAALQRVVLSCQ